MNLAINISDYFSQASKVWLEFWPITAVATAVILLPPIIDTVKMVFEKQPYQMKKRPNHYCKYRKNSSGRLVEMHLNRYKKNVMW